MWKRAYLWVFYKNKSHQEFEASMGKIEYLLSRHMLDDLLKQKMIDKDEYEQIDRKNRITFVGSSDPMAEILPEKDLTLVTNRGFMGVHE
jgi:hypothetical protein